MMMSYNRLMTNTMNAKMQVNNNINMGTTRLIIQVSSIRKIRYCIKWVNIWRISARMSGMHEYKHR